MEAFGQQLEERQIATGTETVGMAPQENRRVARTVFEFVGGDGHAVLDRHVKSPRGLGGDRGHVFRHLLADVIHQFIEEDMTFIDLLRGDKLVRFVRLIDTTRAPDHRWDRHPVGTTPPPCRRRLWRDRSRRQASSPK